MKGYLRTVFMDQDTTCKSARCLEASIDQLTDEHQLYFLGILEALTFAQNIREIPIELEGKHGNE
jgi:hypothetical protein